MGRTGVRRAAAAVIVLAGAALVAVPLALGSLGKAVRAQHVLDRARPVVAAPFLERDFESGLSTATATEGLVSGPVSADLAGALGETPDQFQSQIADQWPDVARVEQQSGSIQSTTAGILANLHRHQHDFEQADSIPFHGLPLQAGVWIVLAIGVVLVAAGSSLLLRPATARATPAAATAAVLGIGFVAFAFVTSVPAKSAATHRVLAAVNLDPARTRQLRDDLTTVQAGFAQFQNQLLPAVAAQLGTTPDALLQQLTASVPGLGPGLQQIPAIAGHFDQAVRFREDNLDNFNAVHDYPFETVVWVELALAGLIGAAGVVALTAGRSGGA